MVTRDVMLRDRFFYPLAVLIIVGMIGFALSFGGGTSFTEEQILAEGWEISGPDLDALTVSPGSEADYLDEDGGFIRLSQFTPFGVGPASIGVFGTLGPDHERAFAGRSLRISMRARATRGNPLESFHAAYYPMEARSSGWKEYELTSDWQEFSYEFTPPIVDAPENVDLVAIFPGRAGEQKQIDLAWIKIEVLDAS